VKVRVVLTVDVDVEAWMLDYGVAREQVRADVQQYMRDAVVAHMGEMGHLLRG